MLNFAVEVGKMLVWDATCPDTYAPLHVSAVAREAGAVAAKAEHLKSAKYAALMVSHHFVPFAIETSGVLGQAALSLVWDIGQRLRQAKGEEHSKEHPLKRIAIAVQRGNAAVVLGALGRREDPFWG